MKLPSIKRVYDKLVHIQTLLESEQEKYLDVDQTALYLAVKKSYIYSLINKRLLPYHKPGGKKVYFLESDLKSWIRSTRFASTNEFSERSEVTDQE